MWGFLCTGFRVLQSLPKGQMHWLGPKTWPLLGKEGELNRVGKGEEVNLCPCDVRTGFYPLQS